MLNIERALTNDRLCKSLTGMSVNEIDNLLVTFEKAYLTPVTLFYLKYRL